MLLDTNPVPTTGLLEPASTWRSRFTARRRLQRIDRLGARLARMDAVEALLQRTGARVSAGWTQDAWFVTSQQGVPEHHVGMLRAEQGVTSDRICLVAAVAVESLPGSITGPTAQRAIGAMWNVLHGGHAAAEWSTAHGVTAARAYDLVRWNDAGDRRKDDVLALVDASRASLSRTATLVREDLARA